MYCINLAFIWMSFISTFAKAPFPPILGTGWNSLTPVDVGDGNVFKLKVTQDVWLENQWNKNNQKFLIVGKHTGWNKKRSLIQFHPITSTDCASTNVRWAKLYIYFEYAHKSSWLSIQNAPYISRPLQVHMVKKEWNEAEATSLRRLNGVNWGSQWLGLNNVDAEALPQDTATIIYARRPKGFVEFDVTNAVKSWINNGNNYGLLLRALDEDVDGRDLRFFSNYEADATKHAFVNVMCDY